MNLDSSLGGDIGRKNFRTLASAMVNEPANNHPMIAGSGEAGADRPKRGPSHVLVRPMGHLPLALLPANVLLRGQRCGKIAAIRREPRH
jgi:hypothetical protein